MRGRGAPGRGRSRPNAATVTDSSGLGLFDSGPRLPVSFYSHAFAAAGAYSYQDSLSPLHTGTVGVPMGVKLKRGMTNQANVVWSTQRATGSSRFDVQVEQPGSAIYLDWRTDQTARRSAFGPTDPLYIGPGVYTFRARLRNASSGAASGYSP